MNGRVLNINNCPDWFNPIGRAPFENEGHARCYEVISKKGILPKEQKLILSNKYLFYIKNQTAA